MHLSTLYLPSVVFFLFNFENNIHVTHALINILVYCGILHSWNLFCDTLSLSFASLNFLSFSPSVWLSFFLSYFHPVSCDPWRTKLLQFFLALPLNTLDTNSWNLRTTPHISILLQYCVHFLFVFLILVLSIVKNVCCMCIININ